MTSPTKSPLGNHEIDEHTMVEATCRRVTLTATNPFSLSEKAISLYSKDAARKLADILTRWVEA